MHDLILLQKVIQVCLVQLFDLKFRAFLCIIVDGNGLGDALLRLSVHPRARVFLVSIVPATPDLASPFKFVDHP